MSISKEKQIRMLDFDFEYVLQEHFPLKLTMVERMEIAKLAARHFNHNKYERKMIKMHQEKVDLENALSSKKKRLREYEDAIIRRNKYIRELEDALHGNENYIHSLEEQLKFIRE